MLKAFRDIVLSLIAILGLLLIPQSAFASTNWKAQAGGGAGNGLVTVDKYYPSTITIDEGDTITWTVEGDAHTISFLSGAPAPDPFSPQAQNPSGGSTYNGTGIVSSGILDPGQSYSLTFTKAGTYVYNCLIHPGMSATVIVNPAGTPYPKTQNTYNQSFRIQKSLRCLNRPKTLKYGQQPLTNSAI